MITSGTFRRGVGHADEPKLDLRRRQQAACSRFTCHRSLLLLLFLLVSLTTHLSGVEVHQSVWFNPLSGAEEAALVLVLDDLPTC